MKSKRKNSQLIKSQSVHVGKSETPVRLPIIEPIQITQYHVIHDGGFRHNPSHEPSASEERYAQSVHFRVGKVHVA